jgi:hypothetical protein
MANAKKINKNIKPKKHFSKRKKIMIVTATITSIFALLGAYMFMGLAYTVARLRCGGDPIIQVGSFEPTQEYMTSNNPMYKYYAKDVFTKYYCTEKQAQADGLHKDLNPTEWEEHQKKTDNDALLQNSPINFPVYTPQVLPAGIIPKDIKHDNFINEKGNRIMQDLYTSNNTWYGYIEQAELDSEYYNGRWVCNVSKYPCQEVGKTASGQIIYKVYYPGSNSTVWGIKLDSTYFAILVFGRGETGLTDQTVLQAFNSLQKVN